MDIREQIQESGYYRIKVIPKQAKTELRDILADGTLKISLKSAPEKGRANKELIKFLAGELQLSQNAIRISSGLTSREKVVSIEFIH
jgi:uncharacterized protein (TIGR00251 family)